VSRLPFVVSLPHAGLEVPPEVVDLHALEPEDVAAESDADAAEIFAPLRDRVAGFVTTEIARVFVDVDRNEDDLRPDGAVKTRTRRRRPIYRAPPDRALVTRLLAAHHRPYHERLRREASEALLGIDCHTRPDSAPVHVVTGSLTCDPHYSELLVACLEHAFGVDVAARRLDAGGHIIRAGPGGISWVRLVVSAEPWAPPRDKARCVAWALDLLHLRLRNALAR
jgi:N-formylglutamate amidohydrolase